MNAAPKPMDGRLHLFPGREHLPKFFEALGPLLGPSFSFSFFKALLAVLVEAARGPARHLLVVLLRVHRESYTAALEASHRRSSGSIRDYVWVFPTSATFGVLLEALPSYGRRHIPMAPLIRPEMKMTVARDSIAVIITDPVLLLGMAPTASAQVKSVFGCAGHPQILSKH